MNYQILDLYSDYLLSSFGQTTATGLARMVNNQVSHDQIIRMLSGEKMTAKTWWKMVKPHVRQMQHEEGVIIIDDSIEEKPYIVSKTETYTDEKSGKQKRKSAQTKNERYRQMLQSVCDNQIPFRYVLNDIWFASAENMRFVKLTLRKEFVMGLKSNRLAALSEEDKAQGLNDYLERAFPMHDFDTPF